MVKSMEKEKHKEQKEIKKCPDCNGDIVHGPNENYCKKCGLVID